MEKIILRPPNLVVSKLLTSLFEQPLAVRSAKEPENAFGEAPQGLTR
jgi:hypothetical protein